METTDQDIISEEVVVSSNNEDQETKDDDKSVGSSSSDDEYNISKHDTLVLPGGGIKGLTILGALQYCCDNFMLTDIVNYVGTSSGSMICYLLAIGYTPTDIITNICCNQIMEKMQKFVFLKLKGKFI